MILSENGFDEKIFLFFSLLDNSIPNLVRLSGLRRTTKDEKGFGLHDPCPWHRGEKSVYCMQRVSGDRSNPEIEQPA
jgi:hypothetical protein